jgi:hypothetical protein
VLLVRRPNVTVPLAPLEQNLITLARIQLR